MLASFFDGSEHDGFRPIAASHALQSWVKSAVQGVNGVYPLSGSPIAWVVARGSGWSCGPAIASLLKCA